MVVCATCGNKRCPHATDCRYLCTGSNEPGQLCVPEFLSDFMPIPTPIPDDLPPGSVAVDWFEHEAWVVPPGTEPVDGWELEDVDRWAPWRLVSGLVRVVRRKPEPPSPDTEDVQLAHAEGRRLPGSSLMRELNSDGEGGWLFLSAGGSWDPLPVNDDGTVTVLKAEDGTR